MVRTKASVGSASVRVAAEKAPRKSFSAPRTSADFSSPSGKKDKSIGGNPVCARPTPTWQKPIANFFTTAPRNQDKMEEPKERPSDEVQATTSCEHFHDDKENKNPEAEVGNSPIEEEQPGPSGISNVKPKRRRVLIESDSDDESS